MQGWQNEYHGLLGSSWLKVKGEDFPQKRGGSEYSHEKGGVGKVGGGCFKKGFITD